MKRATVYLGILLADLACWYAVIQVVRSLWS